VASKSPLKAIRAHCRDCCNNSYKAIEFCSCPDCALWPYRFGIRPSTARRKGYLVDRKDVTDEWLKKSLDEC